MSEKKYVDISGDSKEKTIAGIEDFVAGIGEEIDSISGEDGILETKDGKKERIIGEIVLKAKQKFEEQALRALEKNNTDEQLNAQKKVTLVNKIAEDHKDDIERILEKQGEDSAVTYIISSTEQLFE